MKKLLKSDALELSGIVANSAMNRERVCVGKNSYARELSFDPLDLLKSRLETQGQAAWLDLCCGRGRAFLDPDNLKIPNGANAGNKIIRDLRRIGLKYQARKRLIVCEGRKDFTLNYRYLGADDAAGPNYTGQAAVNSHYEQPDV